jgi:hypothetical protein
LLQLGLGHSLTEELFGIEILSCFWLMGNLIITGGVDLQCWLCAIFLLNFLFNRHILLVGELLNLLLLMVSNFLELVGMGL